MRNKLVFFGLLFCSFVGFSSGNSFFGSDTFFTCYQFKYVNTTAVQYSYITMTGDQIFSFYFQNPFAVLLRSSNLELQTPNNNNVSNTVLNYTRPVKCLSNNYYYNLGFVSPEIYALTSLATSFYASGFTNGFEVAMTNVSYHYLNLHLSAFVSGVITSTNTFYRQKLFSLLSSIDNSISGISFNVQNINTDYTKVNESFLSPDNWTAWQAPSLPLDSSTAALIDQLISNNPVIAPYISSAIRKASEDSFAQLLLDYGRERNNPDSVAYTNSFNDILSNPNLASALSSSPSRQSVDEISRAVKHLSTNDWVSGVKQTLSNNTASVKETLRDMFADNSSFQETLNNINNGNVQVTINNENPLGVSIYWDGLIEVLNRNGFNNSQVLQDIKAQIISSNGTLVNFYNEWYYLYHDQITYQTLKQVYDYIAGVGNLSLRGDILSISNIVSFVGDSLSNVVSLVGFQVSNAVSDVGLNIDKYGSSISNSLFDVVAALEDLKSLMPSNSVSSNGVFSALLLDDYETYIKEGFYQIQFSDLENQYPDIYENLVNLGLETDGNGNWWTAITSAQLFQSVISYSNFFFLSSIYSNIVAVQEFAEDKLSSSGGVSGSVSSIIDSLPNAAQVQEYILSGSVSTNNISSDSLVSSVSSFSNLFINLSAAFPRVSSSPASLVLYRFVPTASKRDLSANFSGIDFSINIKERDNIWSLMRYSIAFAICIVNLILLPKFVLMVFKLFMRLFNRSLPFLSSGND